MGPESHIVAKKNGSRKNWLVGGVRGPFRSRKWISAGG